jgi:hypothetical protein
MLSRVNVVAVASCANIGPHSVTRRASRPIAACRTVISLKPMNGFGLSAISPKSRWRSSCPVEWPPPVHSTASTAGLAKAASRSRAVLGMSRGVSQATVEVSREVDGVAESRKPVVAVTGERVSRTGNAGETTAIVPPGEADGDECLRASGRELVR